MATAKENEPPELDWLQLHNEFEAMHKTESMIDKMKRKSIENPFVPVGCLATLAALSYGLWTFRQGKRKMSQYMMRARILAQGFTIMAFVIGMGISATKAVKKT